MAGNFDLTGLPIYYVNKIISEDMGNGEILVICGIRRGEEFTPLYATISPMQTAILDGTVYVDIARGAGTSH